MSRNPDHIHTWLHLCAIAHGQNRDLPQWLRITHELRVTIGPNDEMSIEAVPSIKSPFKIGDRVTKYASTGEVRSVYTNKAGEIRYVVELDNSDTVIWNGTGLKQPLPDSERAVERVHDLCMDEGTIAGLRAVEARYGD